MEVVKNTTGYYVSYLNYGFCGDGKDVGKLQECSHSNQIETSEVQAEDVTPFCGYYIVGALDRNSFNDANSANINHNKISVFKKLFGGLFGKTAFATDGWIHDQLTKNKLKELPFFHNNKGVIRGCFGARTFNTSAGEAQRGPGCHDIWLSLIHI